jgi:hypothetical protein
MTIPRAKRSDSFVGRGSRSSNLLGSSSSGLVHSRLPPEVNDGRDSVEPVPGSTLAIVEIAKSAMHARKLLLMYILALKTEIE